MKLRSIKRMLCAALALLMLCSATPVSMADSTAQGRICLVAEAGGRLVIAPEYISWSGDESISSSLENSEHQFSGLQDGIVYSIDGVGGNYTRSAQDGSHDIGRAAAEVTHFRFCENTSAQISDALQKLMTAMADYLLENKDVQAAAKSVYDKAFDRFVGVSDSEALALTEDLNDAIDSYKKGLNGTHFKVSFKGFTAAAYEGISITLENSYGRSWQDEDGDGVISVPAGDYSFHIQWNGLHIQGKESISGAKTITAAFPEEQWLVTDSFMLSEAYDEEDFKAAKFTVGQWQDRKVSARVEDSFSGVIYTYAEYDKSIFTNTVPELKAVFTDSDGVSQEQTLAFESYMRGPEKVLSRGAEGNTVIYRVSSIDSGSGYTISQDYTVDLNRSPTLTGFAVKDQNGVAQAATMKFEPRTMEYTYKVLDTVTSLNILPKAMDSSYTVTVNGKAVGEAGVDVAISGETKIPVLVSSNGFTNTYNITVQPGTGKRILFQTSDKGVELSVVNSDGLELPYTRMKDTNDYYLYQYTLVPGESYSYVATRDTWYHSKDSFVLEENSVTTLVVDVPKEDWLTALAMGSGESAGNKGNLPFNETFESARHSYSHTRPDGEANTYIWANTADDTLNVKVLYKGISNTNLYNDSDRVASIAPGQAKGTKMNHFIMGDNPYGNTATVRLSKTVNGVEIYQDYEINVDRSLSLDDMAAYVSSDTVLLEKDDGSTGFESEVRSYTVSVPMAADSLRLDVLSFVESNMNVVADEKGTGTGYRVSVNGQDVTEAASANVELSGTLDTEYISIVVSNDRTPGVTGEYSVTVMKAAPVTLNLSIEPEGALMTVHEKASANRVWPENNVLLLSEGFLYEYTLTAYGYAGQANTMQLLRNENDELYLLHGDEEIPVIVSEDGESSSAQLSLSLTAAPANPTIDRTIEAQWADFRGTAYAYNGSTLVGNVNALTNNCVSDASIPITADEGTLYWASKLGDGWDSGAVGSPIIVDGYLITYSGNTIFRVDTVTGETVATGTMIDTSSFSITPPTYYDGMIFVGLSDGRVQAFNAGTLESLWVFSDGLGGQPNCPITVRDGYLYTGFWVGETDEARFVCMSVTDEDPTSGTEAKIASWYYTNAGGFYWAGAYAGPNYVIVGADDGVYGYTSQSGKLLLLDPKTGRLLDTWDGLNGDVRSSIAYDSATGAFYFTSKGGTFYSVQVSNDGSGWKFTNKWYVTLSNGSGGAAMSTSSPVVYNGRAYIGVCGVGQFAAYSGHNISVIDLTRRAIAYRVDTQGYPQTSGMLTTAYEASSGCVYVYFFDNYTPGKLRVLRDRAGQTGADFVVEENGYTLAYPVFTPTGDQAQYAICSPIVDDFGTVYFKNDSSHLMAFGSMIESLEITKAPDKTSYKEGESFDPSGMEVTAYYANGMFRDVTKYVIWKEDALTTADTAMTVVYPYVMYHNEESGTEIEAGVLTAKPSVDITITVAEKSEEDTETKAILGDVNCDGSVNAADAQHILDHEAGNAVIAESALADVSGDGKLDSNDAVLIMQYVQGSISSFPAADTEE